MDERLKKQLDFALEIDKEKNILRQTHLSGHGRNENDAEHAWHMAIMAYLLREYSNEPVDITRVMLMCLIHDVVEIDAGDTYAYDEEGKKTQKAREEAAKERIYSLLPEDQKEELAAIFDEFEESKTPESKFAHAMDNLQPLMLNNSNDGKNVPTHPSTYIHVTWITVTGLQPKSPTLLLRLNGDWMIDVIRYCLINRSRIYSHTVGLHTRSPLHDTSYLHTQPVCDEVKYHLYVLCHSAISAKTLLSV